jgi:hypothetical protein
MHDYGFRELFKAGFENLQIRLFQVRLGNIAQCCLSTPSNYRGQQLSKLMEEQLPDLHAHFKELNIETHMYASQWFLTLFATKVRPCVPAVAVVF